MATRMRWCRPIMAAKFTPPLRRLPKRRPACIIEIDRKGVACRAFRQRQPIKFTLRPNVSRGFFRLAKTGAAARLKAWRRQRLKVVTGDALKQPQQRYRRDAVVRRLMVADSGGDGMQSGD